MAAFPALLGLLMAAYVTGQSIVTITPLEEVQPVGGELTVICKVHYPIDSCSIKVGSQSYRLKPGNSLEDVVYAGSGLQDGECGAHIKNIKEEYNGEISCVLPPESGNIEVSTSMRLIVAKPPKTSDLLSPPQPSFMLGNTLQAQCIARDARPAAKITWFLTNSEGIPEPLLTDLHEPVVTSLDADLNTISQNISRVLSADDSGKSLICRIEHQAALRPQEWSRQLIVNYPPTVMGTDPLTIFGLKLNEPGRLNVTVRANPRPNIEWTTAEHRLIPPQSTDDGAMQALMPLDLGNGYYNITLVMSPVTKDAVDRTYNLKVGNEFGDQMVAVRLSTMDEPAGPPSSPGVELETGAIVGIVIGVLVVLIAGSLVVFAYATDRWCFGGRRRDNTKSSGESDTESAVGGKERSRLANLGARVRAALPRAKDKVQATEAQPAEHDEKDAEDKVVYAQLALSEQTTGDKPPPPSTEYAEIVYTDQGQKEAKE